MELIKREDECCCCFNKEDLFDMLEPHSFEEKVEIYSTMIAENFHIHINSNIDRWKRNLYLICKNCVYRLRDAIMLRSRVQIAYDRFHDLAKSSNMYNRRSYSETQANILKCDNEEYCTIKREDECCCCFRKEDLFNMLEPYNSEGKFEIYTTMITECFQIDFNSNIDECKRNLYLICKYCVFRLKDAIVLRSQIQTAYDRLQDSAECSVQYNHVYLPMYSDIVKTEISNLAECCKIEKDDHVPTEHSNMQCNETVDSNASYTNALENIDKNKMKNITVVSTKEHFENLRNSGYDVQSQHSDMFLCNICNELFANFDVIQNHVKIHESKCLSCNYCGKVFAKKYGLDNHIKTHLNIKDFVCDICGMAYAIKSNLRVHILKHMNGRNQKCDFCEKSFLYKSNLRRHLETHSPKSVQCMYCSAIFHSKSSLYKHVAKNHTKTNNKTHSDANKFICDICNRFFKQKTYLIDHIMLHMGMKNVKCETCQKYFVSEAALSRHVQSNHVKSISCDYCNKSFSDRNILRQHKRRIHLEKKDYICKICGKTLSTKLTFQNHVLMHSGVKNHKCETCGKAFASRNMLMTHMKIHFNPQRLTCKYCNRTFFNTPALLIHEKIHLNINDFICDYCKKGFRAKYYLKKHMLKHMDVKNIKCDLCDKRFATKGFLTTHKKRSHCVSSSCNVCGKSYKNQYTLKRHMLVMHKDVQKDGV